MSAEKFYNLFSFLYPIIDIFLKAQKRELFKNINGLREGKILEIGVGNGSHLSLYDKHEITAIDTSSKMLEIAGREKSKNVKLLEMSGEELLFANESFDYVILSHVISVVPDLDKMMNEVERVLKKGGKVFILNHFTPNNILKYADYGFSPFSKFFHFKSLFFVEEIESLQQFTLQEEKSLGYFSYYKLLTYEK